MFSFLGSLAVWQKYLAVIVLIGSMFGGTVAWYQSQLTEAYELGVKEATVNLQTEHNKLIAAQLRAHESELQDLIQAHQDEMNLAQKAKDDYWQAKLDQSKLDIEATYNALLKAERIKNEANNVTDILSPTFIRLLNDSRGQVSPPAYYDYPVSRGEGSRVDTVPTRIDYAMLSRLKTTRHFEYAGIGLSETGNRQLPKSTELLLASIQTD